LDCRCDIESKLDQVDRLVKARTATISCKTKKGKAALRRYQKALQNLHSAYDALGDLKRWFSLDVMALIERELDNELLSTTRRIVLPKRSARRAKTAVPLASALLMQWGHEPTVTRDGRWERMTKILANTNESVFEHIRSFKKAKPVFLKFSPGASVCDPGAA
jgi:hypothetical protein